MTDFEALKGKRRTQKSFSKVTQSETRLRKQASFYTTFELSRQAGANEWSPVIVNLGIN